MDMFTPSDFAMLAMTYIQVLNLGKEFRRGKKKDKKLTKQALNNECHFGKEKMYTKGKLLEGKPLLKKMSLGQSMNQVKKQNRL